MASTVNGFSGLGRYELPGEGCVSEDGPEEGSAASWTDWRNRSTSNKVSGSKDKISSSLTIRSIGILKKRPVSAIA